MWLRGRNSSIEQRATVYNELRNYIIDGKMHAEIEATYSLENIKDAVDHAMRQRNGKIIILPNG
jgi:NADPH:quinone reductase-like Zn-dependent oxidoreductase